MLQYPERSSSLSVAKASGAWADFTNKTTVIAKNEIAFPIIIKTINIVDIETNGEYEIKLYSGDSGSETEITAFTFAANANKKTEMLQDGDNALAANARLLFVCHPHQDKYKIQKQ